MRKFAGLDVGTTGAKIVVFGQDGALLDKVYQAYPSSRDKTKQELDASLLRDSVLSLFRRVLDKHPDLEGLGIASFGESFVCLDENDEPVYPILLYTDPRGKDECDRLIASIGEEAIEQKTGLKPHEMYSLPKLAYWKSHDPKGFSSVKKVFLMEDYCLYLLTGKRYIDYSLASRTLGFNLKEKGYDTDIFWALGLDPSLLSTPVPAGTPVRGLREEFGPGHEDFIVLPAGHDQFACSLGSMVLKPGQAMEGAGTVECIVPLVKDIPDLSALTKDNYNLVPYFDRGYLTYAFSYTGGAAVQWLLEKILPEVKAKAEETGKSIHEVLCEKYTHAPTGLLLLPHFAGAATPYMDLGSKAAILGMDLSTDASDLYLAVLEGVAYEAKLNLETLEKDGISVNGLIASGGGSKNPVWNQIKADVIGVPITLLDGEEAGARGSAMLVGIAAKAFASLEEACGAFVRVKGIVEPDPKAREAYAKTYSRYRKIYSAIRPLMEE